MTYLNKAYEKNRFGITIIQITVEAELHRICSLTIYICFELINKKEKKGISVFYARFLSSNSARTTPTTDYCYDYADDCWNKVGFRN